MAATMGKNGSFRIGSALVNFIDSWTVSPSVGTEETTAYGDSWESHLATIKAWAASASGTLDRSDTNQAALLDQLEDGAIADVAVRLLLSTGSIPYWGGNAIVENWSVDSAVKGKVGVSFSLKGNGALAYTTST